MKLSINSLKALNNQYHSASTSNLSEKDLLDKIESQLGGIESIDRLKDKYNQAVIVKIVSCQPHPDADKLQLCLIDDNKKVDSANRNSDGLVEIVCGAPNAREGILVVWLPPGAIVPSSLKTEPFKLEAREIRGKVSNGMLASARELDLFDSHDGIFEINDDKHPGELFAEAYNLKDDIILDLENKMFTHRPDCFGLIGLAREITGIEHAQYKSPDWYVANAKIDTESDDLKVNLNNELPHLVPRFCLAPIKDIKVEPSPTWLQIELAKVGFRPINNIVDLTNYCMYLTAQPLHAYDYDKVKSLSGGDGATIVVRNPKPEESIKLLNGKTIIPRREAIMIATDKQAIGIAGVMGGSETEVDEKTKNILIECASFDMYSIRRTSMEHGLFTDAVTRFTKGQSPLQNIAVLAYTCSKVLKLAGGHLAGNLIDDNNINEDIKSRASLHPDINVPASFINERLGFTLTSEEMANLLRNVEFKVDIKDDELNIRAPFWRTDISLREDIVEEIGRLYGFNNLPVVLPIKSIAPVVKNQLLETKRLIRQRLAKAGANEVLTYSFVNGDLIEKAGQDKNRAFKVSNALSPVLQYYRLSLMPSLLEKVHQNIKAGYEEFVIFELGKTHATDHWDEEGLPSEFEFCGCLIAFSDKTKRTGASYYEAKKYLENLVNVELEYSNLSDEQSDYSVTKPYDKNRSALVHIKDGGEFVGIIGEIKDSVSKALKLPRYCAGFELDVTVLDKYLNKDASYTAIPKFPYVRQDITLKTASSNDYQSVLSCLNNALNDLKPKDTVAKFSPLDIYAPDEEGNTIHYSFRLEIASYNRTLTDTEVNTLLDNIAKTVNEKIGSSRV